MLVKFRSSSLAVNFCKNSYFFTFLSESEAVFGKFYDFFLKKFNLKLKYQAFVVKYGCTVWAAV